MDACVCGVMEYSVGFGVDSELHMSTEKVIIFLLQIIGYNPEFITLPTPTSLCVYLLLSVCFKCTIYAE